MKYVLSIDVGGTSTRVALVNNKYEVIQKFSFATDGESPINTLNQIYSIIQNIDKDIVGIGISCPGPLDLINGVVLTPPNLLGWHQFPLVEELEKITKIPTVLENDANLSGLAEAKIGSGKGYGIVQYLTISTGIGGGLVLDGKIFQGSHGFAQEIANVILIPKGPKVGILQEGSLESISSGTAIVARARAHGMDVEHAGEVFNLAKKGNQKAAEFVDDSMEYLANAIAMLYGVIDPDIVVLGGGVAHKAPDFVESVERRVKLKVYEVLKDKINIVKSTLADDSGLVGGAILAFEQFEKRRV